jgi:hypothetical protein
VQAKLASHDLNAALPIVLLLGSISQQQPALLSEYLPQLEECLDSFAGGWSDLACHSARLFASQQHSTIASQHRSITPSASDALSGSTLVATPSFTQTGCA